MNINEVPTYCNIFITRMVMEHVAVITEIIKSSTQPIVILTRSSYDLGLLLQWITFCM